MDDIYPPDIQRDDPERFMRCQEALHLALASFNRAIAAGWKADEVLTMIIELADSHALMLAANADLGAALAPLKRDHP